MAAFFNSRTRLPWIAFLILSAVWFAGLEYRGLFMPDEGRYADIARNMLDTRDWVTPRLNGLKYFEKPPLQYWATAATFALFGADEWTARLWTALTGFLGILLAAGAASRFAPRAPLAWALAMFAGCWGYFLGSQFLTLDMGLTFFLSAALLAFLLSQRSGISARAEQYWMLFAWAAMGCAVLSKGLIGIVLPALALAVYASIERDGQLLRRLHWIPGLFILCGIALPWFILVQERNPEFFQFFFIREHFERYLLPDHHRPGAWWYYAPVLALALLPWTPCIPSAVRMGWRAPAQSNGFKPERFLVIWSAVIVVFFSASQSKLPGYVLPAFPALLLLLVKHYPDMPEVTRRAPAFACAICGGVLLVGAALLPSVAANRSWLALDADYAVWLLAAAIVMSWAGIHALRLTRAQSNASILVLGLGSLLALQLALSGMHSVDDHFSSERFIEGIVGDELSFPREPPFYSVEIYDQSIPFYLGRPITLVKYQGELAPGIAAEPEKYVDSTSDFVERWMQHAEAFAVMKPSLYEKLKHEGLPSRLLALDTRRAVIARR